MMTTKKITNLAILMFSLVSLFYCYMFFVRVAPCLMTRELMRDLSVHATSIGIMSACFYYAYSAMCLPAGLLLDRYGIRIILTLVALICALSTLMFGCSTNIIAASIARFLMGASGAFSFICTLYIIIRWFPTWHFALFAGIAQMLACGSAFLSQISLPFLISNFNWRYSMIILSFAGLALTVLIWLLIQDHPREFTAPKIKTTSMLVSLNSILRNTQIWYIMLYAFAIWAPIAAFSALWGVPFIKTNCHIHNFEAAKIVSYSWIGIAIGSPIVGWISDKIQRRCLPLAVVALIGCAAILCVIFIPHLSIGTLKLLMFCFGLSAAGQTLIFAVVKDIIPTSIAGTANGLTNMAVVLGGALFQPVIGELLDINWQGMLEHGVRTYDLHSYHIAFIALPICYLLAFVTSAFFIRETHCKITYDQN